MQDGKPKRSWQEIAEEASREQDPQRLLELAHELEAALDKCTKQAGDSDKKPAQTAGEESRLNMLPGQLALAEVLVSTGVIGVPFFLLCRWLLRTRSKKRG